MGVLSKSKSKKTVTSSSSIREEKTRMPPEGATIVEQTVRTTTEEIENGWLLTKNISGRYTEKGSKDNYGNYFDYDQKWFSKDDPLTITVNDKALADAFEE